MIHKWDVVRNPQYCPLQARTCQLDPSRVPWILEHVSAFSSLLVLLDVQCSDTGFTCITCAQLTLGWDARMLLGGKGFLALCLPCQCHVLGVDSLSIRFNHRSFQKPAVSPGPCVVFCRKKDAWKEWKWKVPLEMSLARLELAAHVTREI